MKVVYVCSAWRAADAEARAENRARALTACRDVVRNGDVPVAAHLLYPQFLDDDVPADRDRGIACGLTLLARCDEVLAVGPVSSGMAREIRAAETLGIPVRRRA